MEKLTWTQLKGTLDTISPPIYSIREDSGYINVFVILQGILFDCDIDKASTDYTEFQASYRNKLNKPGAWDINAKQVVASAPFSDTAGFRFRGKSFTGTALASSTTNIDFKLTEDLYINGGVLILNSHGQDDSICFQVVDVDNILGYGLGVVLDEFISNFFIPKNGELLVSLSYPAKLSQGLYVRLKYTNTSSNDLFVKCNLNLHKKTI